MKRPTLLTLFLLSICSLGATLYGQEIQRAAFPLSISYYTPYFIQPGVKLGADFSLHSWQVDPDHANKFRGISARPEAAFFARPGNYMGYSLNVDFGYYGSAAGKKTSHETGIGIGYFSTFQVISESVNLGTGSTTKERETRGYFLPTIYYRFDHRFRSSTGWFVKPAIGRRFSTEYEDAAFFSLDLGIQFLIGNTANDQ